MFEGREAMYNWPGVNRGVLLSVLVVCACTGGALWASQQNDASKIAAQTKQKSAYAPKATDRTAKGKIHKTSIENRHVVSHKNFPNFILKSIDIKGARVIPASKIKSLLDYLIGKEITTKDVYIISEVIEKLYAHAGYSIAEAIIPEQSFKNGHMLIHIIEGYVDKVIISGHDIPPGARELLDAYTDRIMASKPLMRKDLEKYLFLIDDIPGIDISSSFSIPDIKTGATTLSINIDKVQILEGWGGVNNYWTHASGPANYSAGVVLNELVFNGKTSLSGARSTNHRLKAIGFSHSQLFGSRGLELSFSVLRALSRPDLQTSDDVVRASATVVDLDLIYPWKRSFAESLISYISFDFSENKSIGTTALQNYHDKLRSVRLGMRYEVLDQYYGSNILVAQLDKGIPSLGASNGKSDTSYTTGYSGYTKLQAKYLRYHYLSDNYTFLARVAGQYSFDSLLSMEEFDFGGDVVGRGYDPSVLSGDHGATVKLEFIYTNYMPLRVLESIDLYAFYDFGWVTSSKDQVRITVPNTNGLDTRSSASANSVGIGMRIFGREYIDGEIYLAKPLTFPNHKGKHSPRVLFSILGKF